VAAVVVVQIQIRAFLEMAELVVEDVAALKATGLQILAQQIRAAAAELETTRVAD
jgi:hypothetical protein